MPSMPRFNGKATKIAYDILGKPQNLKPEHNETQREIDIRLNYEETRRIR